MRRALASPSSVLSCTAGCSTTHALTHALKWLKRPLRNNVSAAQHKPTFLPSCAHTRPQAQAERPCWRALSSWYQCRRLCLLGQCLLTDLIHARGSLRRKDASLWTSTPHSLPHFTTRPLDHWRHSWFLRLGTVCWDSCGTQTVCLAVWPMVSGTGKG